jgi:cytoskeletal protein RodZ
MSGKRAKPSRWRFLRAAPVVVIAVVWVLVGFFLLLPGSGSDQAHDWDLDPIPSSSEDAGTNDRGSFSAGSPEPSTPATEAPSQTTAEPEDDPTPKQPPAPDLTLSGSTSGSTSEPAPRPTSDPTSPAPTQPTSGQAPVDNPGKKKGHDKPHGPPRDKP